MSRFTLSTAAESAIRSLIATSNCDHPLASMVDASQTSTLPNEVAESLLAATDAERLAYATKRYRDLEPTLQFHLEVGIYESAKIPPQYLALISGIEFAIDPVLLEYLEDYSLDYADNRFLLRKGDRVFDRLMDLGK